MAASTGNLIQFPFAKTLPIPSLRPSPRYPPHLPTPSRRPLHLSSSRRLFAASAYGSGGQVDPAVAAVVDPALHNANVLFFGSGYNVQIVVDEGESEEALLRRFRREVSKAGVIQECKRRRFFENKQEEKKRKAREASRRNRRRRSGPRFSSSSSSGDNDSAPKQSRDDLDDNWEMPEGDLPY
ncbi:small ribosomal subunit protein bS21c [Musa acuminata AAA Group]|uniref:small ribosomal subunit protein bS21c n=1 Tax=Musa acuminata AAA Group TaxID=214697 RepID=UPI0031DC7AA2